MTDVAELGGSPRGQSPLISNERYEPSKALVKGRFVHVNPETQQQEPVDPHSGRPYDPSSIILEAGKFDFGDERKALELFDETKDLPPAEKERLVAEAEATKKKLGISESDMNRTAEWILSHNEVDAGLVARFNKVLRQATLIMNVIGTGKNGDNPLVQIEVVDPEKGGFIYKARDGYMVIDQGQLSNLTAQQLSKLKDKDGNLMLEIMKDDAGNYLAVPPHATQQQQREIFSGMAALQIINQDLQTKYIDRIGGVIKAVHELEKVPGALGINQMHGFIASLIMFDLQYQIDKKQQDLEQIQKDHAQEQKTLAERMSQKEEEITDLKNRMNKIINNNVVRMLERGDNSEIDGFLDDLKPDPNKTLEENAQAIGSKFESLYVGSSGVAHDVFDKASPMQTFRDVEQKINDFMIKNNYENLTNPQYFEDILGLIMLTYGEEYGFDGDRSLMDREGNVHFHNFLKWIEDQMWYFSDFQDDDSFSGYQFIAFYTVFRQISLFEMIVTEPKKYFSKRGVGAKNRLTGQIEYEHDHSDERYMNLRNYLVSLITPANTIHDADVEYTKNFQLRGEEFLNMMRKFYGSQTLTFNSRLLRFMSLLSTDPDEVEEFLTSGRRQNRIGGTLGRGMSGALLLHYHLDQLGHLGEADLVHGKSNFIDGLGANVHENGKMGGRRAFFQSLLYQSIAKSKYASAIIENGQLTNTMRKKGEAISEERDRQGRLLAEFEKLLNTSKDLDERGRASENSYSHIFDNIKADLARGEESVLENMIFYTTKDLALAQDLLKPIRYLLDENNPDTRRILAAEQQNPGTEEFAVLEQKLALKMTELFLGITRKDLNFYNGPKSSNRSTRNVVLEAIEASVQAQYNLNYTDARFGAHFVSLMPSFMGIGAKNDTNIDSTQWWSTVMQFKEYRIRNPKKVDVGDPETFNTVEQFLTFMEAIAIQVGTETTPKRDSDGNLVDKNGKLITNDGQVEYESKAVVVPFYRFVESLRDNVSLIKTKANPDQSEKGPDANKVGDPVIIDNGMKNFVEQHLKGMVDLDGIIKKHKFDLMDVMKQEGGTGKWVEDSQKADDNFFKMLGALRNVISKPAFSAYLNDKNYTIPVRELVLDENGKSTGKYRFVNKTLAEMMFHRNIRNTFVDQLPDEKGKNTIDAKETLVKQMIKFLATMSYERHKFDLFGGWTEAGRQRESKWPTWTIERFQATDYFLMYNLLAEARQYKDKYGEGLEDFIETYHQTRGYFSKADIADTHKVSHTEYWGSGFLGLGGMEASSMWTGLLGVIWLAMFEQFSKGLGEATKFK